MGFNLFLTLISLCIQGNAVSASKAWIVAAKFDPANVSPLCGLNCIKPIGSDPRIPFLNRSVGLHRCTFSPRLWDIQLWTYNSSSNRITIPLWDTNHTHETAIFCLQNRNTTSCDAQITDVAEYPTKLANCTENTPSQEWYVQQDGRIRSGLLSDKGEVLYLQSQSLQTEPGGKAPLCVGPANNNNTERQLYFTLVSFPGNGTLYSALMARIPSPDTGQNLVLNGGFEDTAPRSTSLAPAGNLTLLPGNPDLCYWSVGGYSGTSDGLSSVVLTSPLSNPGWSSPQGNNSLLMGGNRVVMDVTVTQLITTRAGTEYSLSFAMSGYPSPCGNKTLTLQLTPSSNSSNLIADAMFSSRLEATMEWENFSLNFVAQSEATNLTFVNRMRAGICAPVIDNVAVVKLSKHKANTPVAAIAAVSGAVTIAAAVLISFWFLRRRRTAVVSARPVVSSGGEPEFIKHGVSGGGIVHIRTYAMWELREATDNFSTKVGQGGFGAVYRANLGDNRIGAVKRATKRGIRYPQAFKEELSVLLRLNHPNLVNLIGLCFEEGEQILVFEYVPNGNLKDRLHKACGQSESESTPLPWSCRISIALQIAKALQYLHEQAEPPVLHHDVKSSNVLLVDDNHAKLADFGLSKLGLADYEAPPGPAKGSYGYTDPQYIKTGKPSMKSDVYSFGVVLLELMTGLKAVQDYTTLAQWSEEYRLSPDLQVVMSVVDPALEGDFDLGEVNVMVSIVNACLREEGELRPAMGEIVRAISCRTSITSLPPTPLVRNDYDEVLHTYAPSASSYVADGSSASVLYVGR